MRVLLPLVLTVHDIANVKIEAENTKNLSIRDGQTLNYSTNRTKRTASHQSIQCYEHPNKGGDSVKASDYIDDLRNYNFDNKITYCCFSGIWLVYQDPVYNANNDEAMSWWAFGDNYCSNVPTLFHKQASSLRFTGAPDNMRYDTLNLYLNEHFIGDEEFTYVDRPVLNYDNRAKSLIVTGCNPWTLYQYDNYSGLCVCVYPSDTSSCNPGFYSTAASLGPLADQVSSVRRGCHAKDKVWPDN